MGRLCRSQAWSLYSLVGSTLGTTLYLFPDIISLSEELCDAALGFPNNIFRSCNSIEEGQCDLDAWITRFSPHPSLPAAERPMYRGTASSTPPPETLDVDDGSWWCCFAGVEPGVFNGLYVALLLPSAVHTSLKIILQRPIVPCLPCIGWSLAS